MVHLWKEAYKISSKFELTLQKKWQFLKTEMRAYSTESGCRGRNNTRCASVLLLVVFEYFQSAIQAHCLLLPWYMGYIWYKNMLRNLSLQNEQMQRQFISIKCFCLLHLKWYSVFLTPPVLTNARKKVVWLIFKDLS